jgi:hypothetical protein
LRERVAALGDAKHRLGLPGERFVSAETVPLWKQPLTRVSLRLTPVMPSPARGEGAVIGAGRKIRGSGGHS